MMFLKLEMNEFLLFYFHFYIFLNLILLIFSRDILLQVNSKKISLKFNLREIQLHTKFVKEGKATVKLKDEKTNLMISNAPPSSLVSLLKILTAKHASTEPENKIAMKDRLKSLLPKSFDEISPLTSKVK